MRPKVQAVAIDCTDLDAMIEFWGPLLGTRMTPPPKGPATKRPCHQTTPAGG
jgi:hypothetical protein